MIGKLDFKFQLSGLNICFLIDFKKVGSYEIQLFFKIYEQA